MTVSVLAAGLAMESEPPQVSRPKRAAEVVCFYLFPRERRSFYLFGVTLSHQTPRRT